MNPRILVVEDSRVQAEQLRHFLEGEGYKVVLATDGKDALSEIKHDPPDLVITDIVMPNMDGFSLCKQLKLDPVTQSIPIIILTSLVGSDNVIRGLEAGADNFLLKPYTEGTILRQIQTFLSEPTYLAAGNEISVSFRGEDFNIPLDAQKILNFFLTSYEAAVLSYDKLRDMNLELELKVQERTAELEVRAAELARTNTEIEQMNYLASHHLKDPLLRLQSAAEAMGERFKGSVSSTFDRFLESITGSAARMQTILDDLVLYSVPSAEDRVAVETDLNRLVNEIRTDLTDLIKQSNTTLTCDPLPKVMGNPWRIKQVFDKLIRNAIQYQSARAPSITIKGLEETDKWIISVTDNGVGIERRFHESIFVISERMHSDLAFMGTGVSLAICRKALERQGGQIWVESEVGKGSTFYFSLLKHPKNLPSQKT